jgi:hypothetical protein
MAISQVEAGEDSIVSFSKNRTHGKIYALVQENVSLDKDSFLEDLAEALDVEVEDLPEVEATLVITFGNSTIRVPAFEIEEKEEDDE